MNIYELIQDGTNVSLTVSLNDLMQLLTTAIEKAKAELEQTIIAEKTELYLTPEKVAEMLDVDRSTLWRWNKRKYLTTIDIGGKRRYRMSDVRQLLK